MNFTMGKPLAEAFADGVPCERVYYMGFTGDQRWRECGDFPFEWLFVECLIIASSKRRMNTGPEGLFAEAGAEFVARTKALAIGWYEDQGIPVRWSDDALRNVGIALAGIYETSDLFARIARTRINQLRRECYIAEDSLYNKNVTVIAASASSSMIVRLDGIYDPAFIANSEEDAIITFHRTLDYIEHMKHLDCYSMMFSLRRDLTCYVRVLQALCG